MDEHPQVVIIAGPKGAGKTTLAPFLLRDTFGLLEFVNADTISAGLSAFNPETVAFDAGRLMIGRLRELARSGQGFAFESTLATRSYAPWISNLRKSGYEFHLVFLWLRTVELAVERVATRYRSEGISSINPQSAGVIVEDSRTCLNCICHLPTLGLFTITRTLACHC